jgi:hypothetical protein
MKTPRFVKIACVCTYIAGISNVASSGEAPSNLLVNSSFEGGEGSDRIDAWIGEGDHEFREQASVFGYTLGEGTFPDGQYALKMFSGAADVFQDRIDVKGGVAYQIKGMFYHSSRQDVIDPSADSLRAFARVEWLGQDSQLVREDFTSNHNGTMPADSWIPIEAVFIAPTNAVAARLHVQTDIDSGGGSIFADQIFFGLQNKE